VLPRPGGKSRVPAAPASTSDAAAGRRWTEPNRADGHIRKSPPSKQRFRPGLRKIDVGCARGIGRDRAIGAPKIHRTSESSAKSSTQVRTQVHFSLHIFTSTWTNLVLTEWHYWGMKQVRQYIGKRFATETLDSLIEEADSQNSEIKWRIIN
jgi:hypothetical protein